MKLLLFVAGLLLLTVGVLLLRPIARQLPDIGLGNFLIGCFALSMVSGGGRMIWASFFVP